MLITSNAIEDTPGFALQAIPEGKESSLRVDSFIFDTCPTEMTSLHALIAGALLFGDRELERISYPDEEISELAMEKVRAVLGLEGRSAFDDYSFSASDKENSTRIRATKLRVSLRPFISAKTPDRDETLLTLVPGERFSGVLWGVKESILSSNAWLHETYKPGAFVEAAAGVLFAADFLANELSVSSTSKENTVLIRELCAVVDLKVTFEDK